LWYVRSNGTYHRVVTLVYENVRRTDVARSSPDSRTTDDGRFQFFRERQTRVVPVPRSSRNAGRLRRLLDQVFNPTRRGSQHQTVVGGRVLDQLFHGGRVRRAGRRRVRVVVLRESRARHARQIRPFASESGTTQLMVFAQARDTTVLVAF